MEKIAQEKHCAISENEKLTIDYDCNFLEIESGEKSSRTNFENLKKKLSERKKDEIIRGQTFVRARIETTYFLH